MTKERETQNQEKLLKLIAENPALPIVPMVDGEIASDDGYGRWLGAWGSCYVHEYLVSEGRVCFRDGDIEEALTETIGWSAYETMTEKQAEEAYKALPWIKAIIVDIDMP